MRSLWRSSTSRHVLFRTHLRFSAGTPQYVSNLEQLSRLFDHAPQRGRNFYESAIPLLLELPLEQSDPSATRSVVRHITSDLEHVSNDIPYPMLFDLVFAVARFNPLLTDSAREKVALHMRKHFNRLYRHADTQAALADTPPDLLLDVIAAGHLVSPALGAALSDHLAPYLVTRLDVAADVAVARLFSLVIPRAMPYSEGRSRGPVNDLSRRERWARYQRHVTHPVTGSVGDGSTSSLESATPNVENSHGEVSSPRKSKIPRAVCGADFDDGPVVDSTNVHVPMPVFASGSYVGGRDAAAHDPSGERGYVVLGDPAVSRTLDVDSPSFFDSCFVRRSLGSGSGSEVAKAAPVPLTTAHTTLVEFLRRVDAAEGTFFDSVPDPCLPPLAVALPDALQWLYGLPGFERVLITRRVVVALCDLVLDRVDGLGGYGVVCVLTTIADYAQFFALPVQWLKKLPSVLVQAVYDGTFKPLPDEVVTLLAAIAEIYRHAPEAVDPPIPLVDVLVDYLAHGCPLPPTSDCVSQLAAVMILLGVENPNLQDLVTATTFEAANAAAVGAMHSRARKEDMRTYRGQSFSGVHVGSDIVGDMAGRPWLAKTDFKKDREGHRYTKVNPDGHSSSNLLRQFERR